MSGLAAVPGIDCVTLTTNGTGLQSRAQALRQAGLAAVNISLDTLDPAVYERITRQAVAGQGPGGAGGRPGGGAAGEG